MTQNNDICLPVTSRYRTLPVIMTGFTGMVDHVVSVSVEERNLNSLLKGW